MGNVDTGRAFALTQAERTQIMEKAAQSGEYELTRIGGSIHPTPHPGFVHANLTRIPNIDATDPFALTKAEIEGRRQTQEYVRFLQNEHPGFQHAYLAMTASHIGVRETRRLIGEYVLTGDDVVFTFTAFTRNPEDIEELADGHTAVQYREARFLAPSEDVIVLPINNSSVENLATWFGRELRRMLSERFGHAQVRRLQVAISETSGQSGVFELRE